MVRVVDKERVQCGFRLIVPELDLRKESLIRLIGEGRLKINM